MKLTIGIISCNRFKYLNQYAKHRKKQGEIIIKKTNLLNKLNIELLSKNF